MRIFGFEFAIQKAAAPQSALTPIYDSRNGWWPLIRETSAGAWQRNAEPVNPSNAMSFSPVYACVTLIANDIGKLRLKLIQKTGDDIWEEFENPAYSPVIRKPNHYQTRIEFFKSWMFSRLLQGNTYVLKQRNGARKVEAKYVLDPTRVKVLVAPNGEVFYALNVDHLSLQHTDGVVVPASEIIHDKHDAIWHPLVGVTPLTACYLATLQGLRIQQNSENFFANGALPSGILAAPGSISETTAKKLKEIWEQEFTGENAGRVAILSDGLKYEAMTMKATDAQLIEQLKWTAENICTAFHVPPYKIGVGPYPPYNNIEALNTEYYSQALQSPIEAIELHEDEGMNLPADIGVEFDLDQLLRMDTQTRVNVAKEAVASGNFAINESRRRWFGMGPKKGGDSPLVQQQNYSIEALAKRDASDDPFATKPAPAPQAALPAAPDDDEDTDTKALAAEFRKALVA